jgi:tetratricopeptide (TPR) repeat protein
MFFKAAISFLLFLITLAPAALIAASPGLEALRRGRHQEAVDSLLRELQTAPLDPDLRRGLALGYLALGGELLKKNDLAGALDMFRAGAELSGDDGRFPFYIGYVLLRQGKTAEAEGSLLEALREGGPSAEVFHLLGRVCYREGRLYEAQSYLEQAVQLQPQQGEIAEFLVKISHEVNIAEGMETRRGGTFAISYVDGGEELGEQTLEVLQQAYGDLGSLLNAFPEGSVTVILYGKRDFAAVTGAPAWAGGAYDGKIRVPVRGLKEMTPQLRRILYHEYAHLLLWTLTHGKLPLWLNEGLAQIAEGAPIHHRDDNGAPLPFLRLDRSFDGLSAEDAETAYRQSRDFVQWLLEDYGWPRMLDLLQALGRGERFDKAVASSLLYPGEEFAAVQQRWLEQRQGR